MIAFHVETERYLRGCAERFLFEQKLLFAGDSEEKRHVQLVEDQLKAAYECGYLNAKDEVRSTPWEYYLQVLDDGDHRRGCEAYMNVLSELGWEPLAPSGALLIWRRRKAVGQLESTTSDSRLEPQSI